MNKTERDRLERALMAYFKEIHKMKFYTPAHIGLLLNIFGFEILDINNLDNTLIVKGSKGSRLLNELLKKLKITKSKLDSISNIYNNSTDEVTKEDLIEEYKEIIKSTGNIQLDLFWKILHPWYVLQHFIRKFNHRQVYSTGPVIYNFSRLLPIHYQRGTPDQIMLRY